jgi:HEAT repeat protein
MNRIRNLTLLAVGWGLLLSTMVCSVTLNAAVDDVSDRSMPTETVAGGDARTLPQADRSVGTSENFVGGKWAIPVWALWPLGIAEVWLVGWLGVWSVALLTAPKLIFNVDTMLREVTLGRLPFSGGTRMSLSHLIFARAFAQHPRVTDEWVEGHAQAINDWLSIETQDSEVHERDLLIRVDGQAIAVADAPTMRAMLPESPFVLAMHGEGRSWHELVLGIVLRQAMHPERANRMLTHRTVPVVLDRNCVERLRAARVAKSAAPLWLQVVQHELCRIPGVAQSLDDSLLKCLVQSRRILPIVDQWSRTPLALQNALQSAVSAGDLPCLVAFDDDDSVAEMKGVIRARSLTSPQTRSSVSTSTSTRSPQDRAVDRLVNPSVPRSFDATSVPFLIRSLEDSVADIRQSAAYTLGGLGEAASGAAQELTALLNDPVTSCRQAAAVALGAIGPAAEAATASLAKAAVKDHRMVRAAACRALGAIGRPDKDAMNALVNALRDADPTVRSQAARSLGSIGVASPEAVSALKVALSDESADVRCRVVTAISAMPDALNELLTGFVAAIADPAVEVRREVATALGKTERARDAVVKTLSYSLSDPDAETRVRAAAALSRFGQASRSAVPQLSRMVRDSDANVRRNAVTALDAIGFPSLESVSAIEEATHDADDTVQSAARSALARVMKMSAAA